MTKVANEIPNVKKSGWAAKAFPSEFELILTSLAVHDNRMEFDLDEVPCTIVAERTLPEMALQKVRTTKEQRCFGYYRKREI